MLIQEGVDIIVMLLTFLHLKARYQQIGKENGVILTQISRFFGGFNINIHKETIEIWTHQQMLPNTQSTEKNAHC